MQVDRRLFYAKVVSLFLPKHPSFRLNLYNNYLLYCFEIIFIMDNQGRTAMRRLAVSIAALAAVFVAFSAGVARAATPFPCDGHLYQIATNQSVLKELEFTATANGYTTSFNNIGSAGTNLNSGWGYNSQDNLIYGVVNNTRRLYQVDYDANFTQTAVLDNTFRLGSFVGDVLDNNIMVYRARTPSNVWQFVEISDPANPVNLGEVEIDPNVSGADFAFNPVDGNIYGISGGSTDRLYYIDIASIMPSIGNPIPPGTTLAPNYFGPAGAFPGGYGAMWFDQDGRLYIYDNNTNEIFVVNVGIDGSGTGNATLLAVSTEDEGGINDGAYCRGPAPVPIGAASGTLFVDSDSNDLMGLGEQTLGAGITVNIYYDNGTPLNTDDDSFLGTTETQADGTYLFDGLVTIETYRIEVDLSDPDLPFGAVPGTSNPLVNVSVAADTTTEDQDFGFDPNGADLRISKTANVTVAAPGDTVIWTIAVTNDGIGSPAGVRVDERIPSGFSYVSDDAPAVGDIYDVGLGIWFVDEILPGATETLTITTVANSGGERTNKVEIIFTSLDEPDSDESVGVLQDDLGDGIADDDEASFTVTEQIGTELSGMIFLDNGLDATGVPAGAGTAHDGLINGAETGGRLATVTILETAGGTVISTAPINTDGMWSVTLPEGFSQEITVVATPEIGALSISENTGALPGLSNPSMTDGAFTFTPPSNSVFTGLDFGLIEEPTLTQNQSGAAAAGQIVELPHVYSASSAGSVSFALVDPVANPANGFSSVMLLDADCDGQGESVLGSPTAVNAGQLVCLTVRTQAGGGIGNAATFTYGLTAQTSFTGTMLTHDLRNDDSLGAFQGDLLTLEKLVRNVSTGSPESRSNAGSPNDVLEYRLILSNPAAKPVTDVTVNDATPAYTALSGPISDPVTVVPGVTCAVAEPAAGLNIAGYAGPLRWECPGTFPAGQIGSLTFQVRIVP